MGRGPMQFSIKESLLAFKSRFIATRFDGKADGYQAWVKKNPKGKLILDTYTAKQKLSPSFCQPVVSRGISPINLLQRTITLPLTKASAIEEALSYQLSNLFPTLTAPLYTYAIIGQQQNETTLCCFAADAQIQQLNHCDHLTSLPLSLPVFIDHFYPKLKTTAIICFYTDKLFLLILRDQSNLISFSATSISDESVDQSLYTTIEQTLNEWETLYSLPSTNILCLGPKASLVNTIFDKIQTTSQFIRTFLPDLNDTPTGEINSTIEALSYAAHAALNPNKTLLPEETSRLSRFNQLKPLFTLSLLIAGSAWSMLWITTSFQQSQKTRAVKQMLLNSLEQYYPEAPPFADGLSWDSPEVEQTTQNWSLDDIEKQLDTLKRSVKSAPQVYALFPNTPKVIDTLSWIGTLAHSITQNDPNLTFKIDKFQYKMVKRPTISRPNDRYQVKVTLELSTTDPEAAKQFYNKIYEPNAFIDPNQDIKWTASTGSYQVSFFLKDKTFYPTTSRSRL